MSNRFVFWHCLAVLSFLSLASGALSVDGVETTSKESDVSATYHAHASGADLGEGGSVTLLSAVLSPEGHRSSDGLDMPKTGEELNNGKANYHDGVVLRNYTGTYTMTLDTSVHTQGYDLSKISSFAGWEETDKTLKNGSQDFEVLVSTVGSPNFISLGTVTFGTRGGKGSSATYVQITDASAALLETGVDAVRFTFDGERGVYQEFDLFGVPSESTTDPAPILSVPSPRVIYQRDASDEGAIPIVGTYQGAPDQIEARLILTGGGIGGGAGGGAGGGTEGLASFGLDSSWQIIEVSPTGGSFSGTLPNVPAGGWYDLEVRTVEAGNPSFTALIERVGIGDIYLLAGGSNAASYGSSSGGVSDDRLSALTNVRTTVDWVLATDPMPHASGEDGGTGDSPFTRLGEMLVAQENVPIGFVSLAQDDAPVHLWLPPGSTHLPPGAAAGTYYDSLLLPAIQNFSAQGFRAILWHQGEGDSTLIPSTTTADYQSRLAEVIARSRVDAGWSIPWYVAEASYHPSSTLVQELPITAGQRAVAFSDPQTHLGPATDDYHLESKTHDGLHFNASGLLDHATQWLDLLNGTSVLEVANFNFEANANQGGSAGGALADGGIYFVDGDSLSSPAVLGWQVLAASGSGSADCSAGYFNPNEVYYSNALDSINGGVMPGMSGRHVAFLFGGSPGDCIVQTFRATLQPDHQYSLSVLLGVRDVDVFGEARIDLLADGVPLGAGVTVTLADLNALAGGSAAGKFTEVRLTFTTGESVLPNQTLGVRISKILGAPSYLDIAQVRFGDVGTPLDGSVFWFLGDSIIQSNADGDSNSSPRKSLHDLLSADGVNFSYTGHFATNVDGLPSSGGAVETNLFHYHSGVSASVIGDDWSGRVGMTQNLSSFWSSGRLAVVRPGIIVIKLGTNDLGIDLDVANAPARLSNLMASIYALPGVGDPTIFVSSVAPNRMDAEVPDRVAAFNAALPDLVSDWQEQGRDVYFVDLFTVLNDNYAIAMRGDDLHPNSLGNDLMAAEWYKAIKQRFAPTNPASWEAWQFANFGSAWATDAGASEDPDGDGEENFLEFVFGADPQDGGSRVQPVSFDGETLTVTRRVSASAGVVYELEGSSSLLPGSWVPVANTENTVVSKAGDFETVAITPGGGGWGSTFLRMKARVAP